MAEHDALVPVARRVIEAWKAMDKAIAESEEALAVETRAVLAREALAVAALETREAEARVVAAQDRAAARRLRQFGYYREQELQRVRTAQAQAEAAREAQAVAAQNAVDREREAEEAMARIHFLLWVGQ